MSDAWCVCGHRWSDHRNLGTCCWQDICKCQGFLVRPEQREREARPKESACPAWEDGQHCFAQVSTYGTARNDLKSCACGKTIGRTKP